MSGRPSDYERQALERIHEWKAPEQRWFGQTIRQIGWPVECLGGLLGSAADAVGLSDLVTKALEGIVRVLADAAAWSVSQEATCKEFRKARHDVGQHADLFALDLEEVDQVVRWLDAKYKSAAFTEGTTTGAIGVPGLIADIPALVTLNLRAIFEHATYYGFNVACQRERLFAMQVLGLASSPSATAKVPAMAQLARIAAEAAKGKAWRHIEKAALASVIRQIARALDIRLTKAKRAQAFPIVGAAVGGGFNAYYTARVCDAGYHLHRERFLAEKYGPGVIDETAERVEGEGVEPRYYPEAFEEIPSHLP